jgi:hypothetical protein
MVVVDVVGLLITKTARCGEGVIYDVMPEREQAQWLLSLVPLSFFYAPN